MGGDRPGVVDAAGREHEPRESRPRMALPFRFAKSREAQIRTTINARTLRNSGAASVCWRRMLFITQTRRIGPIGLADRRSPDIFSAKSYPRHSQQDRHRLGACANPKFSGNATLIGGDGAISAR